MGIVLDFLRKKRSRYKKSEMVAAKIQKLGPLVEKGVRIIGTKVVGEVAASS